MTLTKNKLFSMLWAPSLEFSNDLLNDSRISTIYLFSISTSYNNLISMGKKYNINKNVSICNNTCPYLMFPCRRISVTRLLQIIAHNRAELCCHKLIDCLLETYKVYESSDDDNSDNSSLEIYMWVNITCFRTRVCF